MITRPKSDGCLKLSCGELDKDLPHNSYYDFIKKEISVLSQVTDLVYNSHKHVFHKNVNLLVKIVSSI